MKFSIQSNQHGTLQSDPVDANGNPATQTGDPSAVSSDPTVIVVTPVLGAPNQFTISTQGKVGSADVTVSGKDANGGPFSTVATFAVTSPVAGLAVGFKLQLLNVA